MGQAISLPGKPKTSAEHLKMTPQLPVLSFPRLYHVGKLEEREGRREVISLEGPGLSVSTHPEAWQQISHPDGPCWELQPSENEKGEFVDFYQISQPQKQKLRQRARERGLIKQEQLWQVRWHDTEWEETFTQLFDSRQQAQQELEGGRQLEAVMGWQAGSALEAWWQQHFSQELPLTLVEEMALRREIELMNRWEGVWWNHELAPYRLSAPAGVIFPHRVQYWNARQVPSSQDRIR